MTPICWGVEVNPAYGIQNGRVVARIFHTEAGWEAIMDGIPNSTHPSEQAAKLHCETADVRLPPAPRREPNTQGLPDWSAWVPAYLDAGDTFKMRVPGGWLVRVFDEERHMPRRSVSEMGIPGDHSENVASHHRGKSHVLFIPDPTQSPHAA